MFDEATSLTFRKVEPLKASVRSCGQLDLSPHIKGSHWYRVSKLDCHIHIVTSRVRITGSTTLYPYASIKGCRYKGSYVRVLVEGM